MGWKNNLCTIQNATIENYLKKLDFYESTMSPRFIAGDSNLIQNPDSKCLRLDTDYKDYVDYTLRIFVSNTEVYVELQNGWRGFEFGRHESIDSDITIEELDEILDRLTE